MLEIRISAPGLSSTRTDSVWITGPAPPARVAVLDQVERGRAGRDHREAVLGRVDAAVDDGRAAAGERLLERGVELVLVVDA